LSASGVVIRHLWFTGAALKPAGLDFVDGLNVVWGASNTGKSFALKAIDFMLGKDELSNIDERKGYDGIWMGLSVPEVGDKTIYRSTFGGECLLFDGLIRETPPNITGQPINLDSLLLGSVGLANKKVVKDANGQKLSLTLRNMIHHLLVDEGFVMGETSPIYRGQFHLRTSEKNILRLLLTGVDDSAVVQSLSKKTNGVQVKAKIELIDELVSEIDVKLGDRIERRVEIENDLELIKASTTVAQEKLQNILTDIDTKTHRRRQIFDQRSLEIARVRELDLTIRRFEWLAKSYQSDLQRLDALTEAGELIATRTGRPCSLCGAPPEQQTHPLVASDIHRSQAAATAEARRIRRDQRDLESTIASLRAESVGVRRSIEVIDEDISILDRAISDLRPIESALRNEFDSKWTLQTEALDVQRLFSDRDSFLARKIDVKTANKGLTTPEKIRIGIDGPTGHSLAQTIEEVLHKWQFPNMPTVSFNDATQDIRINGKDRKDNGKGVRAVLHAAFKVAIAICCRRHNLPHPGFLVLDSPLMAYRDPLTSRYGALTDDEKEIQTTRLADHFYSHLSSLRDIVQIIVLENTAPSQIVGGNACVTVFEGPGGNNREGFF
jgi:hypothetical protein